MISQPKYRIPKKGLTVWRIHAALEAVILLVFVIVAIVLAYVFDWPKWIYLISIVVMIADLVFGIYFFPKIRWEHWRHEVREQEIEIQQGLFIVKRTLVPMVRVQHVDTSQGPILKHYHLASMSISTAATTHTIPALTEQEADQLRVHISELARVAEDDV